MYRHDTPSSGKAVVMEMLYSIVENAIVCKYCVISFNNTQHVLNMQNRYGKACNVSV